MSVLIKGMKMPKGCLGCPCINAKYDECMVLQKRSYDVMTRMTDCPLVPVETREDALKILDEVQDKMRWTDDEEG